jgi:hypothetical protein
MTRLEYCPTEDMVADGLTKALGPERHRKLAKRMGMGVWQKSEDYAREITRIRSGSDERASSPVSPVTYEANTNHMTEGVGVKPSTGG